MKIYQFDRTYFKAINNIMCQLPPVRGFLITKKQKFLIFEEGKWERGTSGIVLRAHLLGADNVRESSMLELLLHTGMTDKDIPFTKWERFTDRLSEKWRRFRKK